MQQYHDEEWGVPVHDDRKWFEFMILDGFQAGLSWNTILNKRENFREAFDGFHIETVANYTEVKVNELLENTGIIRNRLKIQSAITNARAVIEIQQGFGSLDAYLWQFTGGITLQNHWPSMSQMPATTPESDAMSKDLKKRGLKFVGSTICYAFMQSGGMVNDHTVDCFRHNQLLQK